MPPPNCGPEPSRPEFGMGHPPMVSGARGILPAMPRGRVPRKHELIRKLPPARTPLIPGLSGAIEARTVSGMFFLVSASSRKRKNKGYPPRKEKFVLRPAIRDQKRAPGIFCTPGRSLGGYYFPYNWCTRPFRYSTGRHLDVPPPSDGRSHPGQNS